MNKRLTRIVATCMIQILCLTAVPVQGATRYLPDVSSVMSSPSYWSEKDASPDQVLVTPEEISKINADIIKAEEITGVCDLSAWTDDTFNGIQRTVELKNKASEDAWKRYDEDGAEYDADGKKVSSWEEALEKIYSPMIDNCIDPDATESMQTGYAICTNRTNLRYFPSDTPLLDDVDFSDPEFNLQYLTAVNLGEPLIIRGKSGDGKFYSAKTSYYEGWIPSEDIAFCKDRAEWLDAWNYEDDQTLVVYGDKIITEASNTSSQTGNRKLYMGTRLQIADQSEWAKRISNRLAYNNYVVWFPVRLSDGNFEKQLALISEHCKVSRGYLPLTTSNLANVIFNQLGNTYGWGGMVDSQDCSGFVKAVYECFGIHMARDTGNQAAQPVKKYNLDGKSDAEKAEIIKSLPLGSELLFNGHAMIYLGTEGDKLYVISSVSNLFVGGERYKARGVIINTLDVTRRVKVDGVYTYPSWLSCLHTATIPYYQADAQDISKAVVTDIPDAIYTGQAVEPVPEVVYDGQTLEENVHYTLFYKDNIDQGTATVTITGKGNYTGSIDKTFNIKAADKKVTVSLKKNVYPYTGKTVKPEVTVYAGASKLDPSLYTVSYAAGSKKVGTYKATVKLGKGYSGSAAASYKIVPEGTSISKVSKGKQSFTARWKKQAKKMSSSGITGYQLQYATNKKFTNGKETVTIKGYKNVSGKVTQLRGNKKYYVRVRTYKVIGKNKYYSAWSKMKTVKTR